MATQPTTAIQKPASNLATVQQLLEKYKQQISVALPRHMTPERMIRVALTCVSQSPLLQKCDPYTLCGAVVQSSILGLEPNSNLGESFLIPYWSSKANGGRGGYECQLQIGYKGHVKLARNSGEIAMVDAQPVYDKDDFECEKGDNPYLRHKWAKIGERGSIIGYWAGFKTKDGTFSFEYWSVEQIEAHRDRYSQGAYKKERGQFVLDKDGNKILQGPWADSPDWMFRKTVLIQALKLAPKSVQLQTAISLDERAEAGTPQQFSIEVPLELQPPQDDPHEQGAGPVEMPKRKSEVESAVAPAEAQEASDLPPVPAGFPQPFSIGAFIDGMHGLRDRITRKLGTELAEQDYRKALATVKAKKANEIKSESTARLAWAHLLAVTETAEKMRESGEDE